jgi:hypothetical protein
VTERVTYSVAAERPAAVREDLQRIWRENLALGVSPDAKYRWLYEEAPDVAARVFVLRARGAAGAEHVVGTKGVSPRRYWLRDRELRAGVSGDFAVEVPHRHLMPALQLARAAREYVKRELDLGYGLPNDRAEAVMLRAGFRALGRMQRHVRVLRHAAYVRVASEREELPTLLRRAAASAALARVGGPVADAARLALAAPRAARAAARLRFAWRERPDRTFDELWAAARGEYDVVGARTCAFLAWRCPRARFATVARRTDGALRAYALVEADEASGAAHLRDLFGHADDLGALVDLLLPALWLEGFASVSVRFMGAPRVARLLAARGFVVRDASRAVIVQLGDRAPTDRGIDVADRWHLFDVDEDA